MILVTGAAGQLGRLVIENLLERIPASQIVAAVRHPEKATDLQDRGVVVRQADYDRPEHWPSALEGVEKVLLISAPDIGQRLSQHKVAVDAVKNSGSVKLLAYTSMLRADTCRIAFASEDRETERLVRETGVTYVFLRHGWYTENYTAYAASAAQEAALYGCAKDGRISAATRADYAAAAATVLTSTEKLRPVYELAGDTSFTLQEVAAEIAAQSARPVAYIDMSEQGYRAHLLSYGLPENVATTLAMADTGAANGEVYSEVRDLSSLIGRGTTSLAAAVAAALANQQGAS